MPSAGVTAKLWRALEPPNPCAPPDDPPLRVAVRLRAGRHPLQFDPEGDRAAKPLRREPDAALSVDSSGIARATGVLARVRRALRGAVGLTCAVGLVATGLLATAAQLSYLHTERQLTRLETTLGAFELRARLLNVEQPMLTALGTTASSPDPVTTFERTLEASIAPSGPISAASLLRISNGRCERLVAIGRVLSLLQQPAVRARACAEALRGKGLMTVRLPGRGAERFGYLLAAKGSAGHLVIAASRTLPSDHRLPELAGAPYAKLEFALYFGRHTTRSALVATDAPRHGLSGVTSTVTVPFGSNVLSVVGEARTPLAGELADLFPWLIALIGVAATAGTAFIVHLVTERRRRAEQIGKALRFQESVAHELQHALLPRELPHVVGVEYGVRYLPEMRGVDVGGDWYDAMAVGDGSVFLSIGDVSGHGLDAATMMGAVRSSIRAFASEDPRPDTVLNRLAEQYARSNERHFATVCCATIEPVTGRIVVASAGHPPPLFVSRGMARLLSVRPGPPIGVSSHRYRPTIEIAVDETTLLLYTDGLIERRGEVLGEGLSRLLDAATPAAPLDALCDRVLSELVPGGAHDDVALLAVSVRPTTGGWMPIQRSLALDPLPRTVGEARRFVHAETEGLPDPVRESASLLASELATNAIVHAKSAYVVALERTASQLRLSVSDCAPERPLELRAPGPDSTSGRGLPLLRALSREWGVDYDRDRLTKTVWCTLLVAPKSEANAPVS